MNIIHVIVAFNIGGSETLLVNLANEQIKNHNVTIMILMKQYDNSLIQRLDTRIKFLCAGRKNKSINIFPILTFNYWLYSQKPDVIHLHGLECGRFILPFFLKKSIATLHTTILKSPKFPYSHSIIKRLYAISDGVAQSALDKIGKKTKVINNGIIVKEIKYVIPSNLNNNNTFTIVLVGRLEHHIKGQDVFIKALKELHNQGISNIVASIIGSGSSASYLQNLVLQLGIQSKVNFLGLKDQAYIFTHLCDYNLFVQPSLIEGFGLTIAEAMAAKVPVLVSDIPGPMEVIEQGRCGYYFKCGNINDCVNKIKSILQSGRDEQMVERAYQRVLEKYDVAVTAQKYVEEYKNND